MGAAVVGVFFIFYFGLQARSVTELAEFAVCCGNYPGPFARLHTDIMHNIDEGLSKMVFKLAHDLAGPAGQPELGRR